MTILQLALKAEYFDAIAAGEKTEEFREANAYWTKRLEGRSFSKIVLTKGYPPKTDASRRIICPWKGLVRKTIIHEHFGNEPIEVFAISVCNPNKLENHKMKVCNEITAAAEMLPLSQLVLSDLNPRKEIDEDRIQSLAESISMSGLLQNLLGYRPDGSDVVEIVGGGRRLRALQLLDEQGQAPQLIPVRVTSDEIEAHAWGLSENANREEIERLDQINAIFAFSDKTKSLVELADTFDMTVREMKTILAMKTLPSEILESFFSGDLSLEDAAHFCAPISDEERLRVFNSLVNGEIYNYQLRNILQRHKQTTSGRFGTFVGEQAYIEAGGTIARDLIDDKLSYFDDTQLIESLAIAKFKTLADEALQAGFKFVEFDPKEASTWSAKQSFGLLTIEGDINPLTEDEQKEQEALVEQANAAMEADDWSTYHKLNRQVVKPVMKFSDDLKKLVGTLIVVDHNGEAQIIEGVYRDEDASALAELGLIEPPAAPQKPALTNDRAKENGFSQALQTDLQNTMLGAVQSALVGNEDLMIDVLSYAMTRGSYMLGLNVDEQKIGMECDESIEFDNRLISDREWDAKISRDDFLEYQSKDRSEKLGVILSALIRGLKYNAGPEMGQSNERQALFDEIADQSGASIRRHWTLNSPNFFKRVKGAYLVDLFATVMGLAEDSDEVKGFAKNKSAEKVRLMDEVFTKGTFDGEPLSDDQLERVATWVPEF